MPDVLTPRQRLELALHALESAAQTERGEAAIATLAAKAIEARRAFEAYVQSRFDAVRERRAA